LSSLICSKDVATFVVSGSPPLHNGASSGMKAGGLEMPLCDRDPYRGGGKPRKITENLSVYPVVKPDKRCLAAYPVPRLANFLYWL
jgi:hypothetical protein